MTQVICTVDIVLLTLHQESLQVALLRRDHAPFEGDYALPGGYIHAEQDGNAYEAAMRVIRAKTGIVPPYLEQLATFSGPARDPRGWSVSIAHYALVPYEIVAGLADDVRLAPASATGELPFDHAAIVAAAVERLRNKSQYSSLPCFLAGETFTLPQLQRLYEIVLGEPLNKVSFRRKMSEMDMLEAVDGQFTEASAHRPAQLYRLKDASRPLHLLQRGL